MTSAEKTRPGCLVLVVGPSGSGKDTLIRAARARLGADNQFLFVRRVITRGTDAHEEHEFVTDEVFASREDRGEFSLSWSAHGLQYGAPRAIDDAIADGKTAICNVSRTVIDVARSRYSHVVVVEVAAPVEVLVSRLSKRARETVEDQANRLLRSMQIPITSDVRIENTGSVEQAAALLVAAIERASRGCR